MEAQSYYQNAGTGAPPLPAALRWVRAAFGVLVVVLLALPVLMTVDRDFVTTSVLREDPALSGGQLQFAITASLIFSWGVHVMYAAVGLWFVLKTLAGRQWARIALTILLVIATANSVDSAMKGPEFYGWVISGDILQITIIVLLWAPRTTRAYFARHREPGRQAGGPVTETAS